MKRHSLFKKMISVGLAAAMMVSMTACSSGDGDAGKTAGAETTAGAAQKESEADNGDVTFTFSTKESFSTLDPFADTVTSLVEVNYLYADILFATDHLGNYTPWIATDWEMSEDGLALTVHLRDDVYFSSGTKLTAEDVKFTYERVALGENLKNAKLQGELESVEVVDDTTCIFHFTKPTPRFFVDSIRFGILSKEAYDADPDTFFRHPVGSGPFIVTDFDPNTSDITFERNDDWWAWTEENKSNVDIIKYTAIPDETSRTSALRAGEIDLVEDISLDDISVLESEGMKAETFFQQRHYFFAVNCNEGNPLSDLKVRQALSMCIDRESICSAILGGGEPADWPFASFMAGYDAENAGYEYDPEAAKALLEESSYNGEEITILYGNGVMPRGDEVMQAIQAMANAIGFNISIEILDNATVVEKRESGEYDLCVGGQTAQGGEPFNEYIQILGRMDKFCTGLVDQELFSIIDEVSTEMDAEVRNEKLKTAFKRVKDNLNFIYLVNPEIAVGMAADVDGIALSTDAFHDYRYVTKGK